MEIIHATVEEQYIAVMSNVCDTHVYNSETDLHRIEVISTGRYPAFVEDILAGSFKGAFPKCDDESGAMSSLSLLSSLVFGIQAELSSTVYNLFSPEMRQITQLDPRLLEFFSVQRALTLISAFLSLSTQQPCFQQHQ